ETYEQMGRITTLIDTGELFDKLGVPALNPETDRGMICGSMEMITDTKQRLLDADLVEGSNAAPAQFVIEKAFAG
ncbi:MAG: ferredoxin--NADP reductase, partial [Pseudomonadota bacterium]